MPDQYLKKIRREYQHAHHHHAVFKRQIEPAAHLGQYWRQYPAEHIHEKMDHRQYHQLNPLRLSTLHIQTSATFLYLYY